MPYLALLGLGMAAQLAWGQEEDFKQVWAKGCGQFEYIRVKPCQEFDNDNERRDSVRLTLPFIGGWGDVDTFGFVDLDGLFDDCIGLVFVNGRTRAIKGTLPEFDAIYEKAILQRRICGYKLQQIQVTIESQRGKTKVEDGQGDSAHVEVEN